MGTSINRQPGIHTIRLIVKDAAGNFTNTCIEKFELLNNTPPNTTDTSFKNYESNRGDNLWRIVTNQLKENNIPVNNINVNYLKNMYIIENNLTQYKSGIYGVNENTSIKLYSKDELQKKIDLLRSNDKQAVKMANNYFNWYTYIYS